MLLYVPSTVEMFSVITNNFKSNSKKLWEAGREGPDSRGPGGRRGGHIFLVS